jgi:hypothetical protein
VGPDDHHLDGAIPGRHRIRERLVIGHSVAGAIVAREEEANPAVVELATLLSLSSRIEPELLRAVRLAAAPQLHAGVEGDLWFSPLVASRGPDGITFYPEVTELLRRRLRDQVKRETVGQVWRVTQRLHRNLSPALALEERVAWHATVEASMSTQAIENELSRALVTLIEEDRPGVARWVAQAWPRLPVEARSTRTAWQLKEASSPYLGAYRIRADEAPEGLGEVDLRATVERLSDVRLPVRRVGRLIQFGRVKPDRAVAIRVPDTDPRVVELRWSQADRGHRELVQVRPLRAAHHPVGFGPIELRTLRGALYQLPGRRPIAVFLSSIPTDGEALASQLASELRRHGFRLERPSDSSQPGARLSGTAEASLDAADILVLLLTPDALRSQALQAAWRGAVASGKPILPAMREVTADELPEELRSLQPLDLRGLDLDGAVAQLLAAIDTITEALPEDEREPTSAPARTSDLGESVETKAMSGLINTFADLLLLFAHSVDIVDQGTFNRVRDHVVNYMRNELEAAYFGVMTSSVIDGQPGLQTTWSSGDQASATTIRSGENYTRQVALAFDQRRPLWVVSADGGPLRDVADSTGFVDQWSVITGLPRYVSPVDAPMKTSIMVPLVHSGRPLGVMNLESVSYVEATAVAKQELTTLAEAIAILIELRAANRLQTEGTEQAVGQLGRFLGVAKFPRLTKPSLFVASADDADRTVLGVLKEVLAEFDSKLTVFDWQEITDAGAITTQIADRVVRSRYGICYFSEPAPPGVEYRYADNPNVTFEAGMLHAQVNSPDAPPSGWIPVREDDSPPAPFDFADQRIERVPRDQQGQVDEERFRAQMRRRITALLRDDSG